MDKIRQTALDWIESHVRYCLWDCSDSLREINRLEARFEALTDDKGDIEDYVKNNLKDEYIAATKQEVEDQGEVYPDYLYNTPSKVLIKQI